MPGIFGGGGSGESDNYKVYDLTTHGTGSTEKSQDVGQPVFNTLLVNDSDTDITIGFDNNTTTANKVWTLKAGEIISIDLVWQTIYYKSTGTSKAFRLLVIW